MEETKTGNEDPASHGVTWAGLDSVFRNKGKPEEREERSAFENLFSHSLWVSLSTYSLGHNFLDNNILGDLKSQQVGAR